MNSDEQCVNSEPMWGYCSRAGKKKKKAKRETENATISSIQTLTISSKIFYSIFLYILFKEFSLSLSLSLSLSCQINFCLIILISFCRIIQAYVKEAIVEFNVIESMKLYDVDSNIILFSSDWWILLDIKSFHSKRITRIHKAMRSIEWERVHWIR